MRIITESWLRRQAAEHPESVRYLTAWRQLVRAARWSSLVDVRRDFTSADPVEVASGRTVYVFNIAGNKYRMIVALHFNIGRVFTLRLLTHADYSKGHWKDHL